MRLAEPGFDCGRVGRSDRPDHGFVPVKLAAVRAALPRNLGLLALLTAVFILVRLGETLGAAPGWARSYVDDFLCLPLVLSLALMAQRLFGRRVRAALPLSHGLLALGVFAVFFEGVLPRTGSGAVADTVDLLMYLAGFLVFQFGLNGYVAEPSDQADIHGMKFSPMTRTN
jgi:hypothetical protein